MFAVRLIASVLALFGATSQVAYAGATSPPAGLAVEGALDHPPFGGPGSVWGQIQSDAEPRTPLARLDIAPAAQRSYQDFKGWARKAYGLTFGIDYNLLSQHASKSPGEQNAAGGALLERSISAGLGRYTADGQGVFGLGFNWGRPNRALFGADARDQYTAEMYYRLQLAEHLAITPDIQLIQDPALNPGEDFVWVSGLRARLAF